MATFVANEINATDRDVESYRSPKMFPLKDKNINNAELYEPFVLGRR